MIIAGTKMFLMTYAGWYSLSNGIIPLYLPRGLDLNFQGQMFKNEYLANGKS